MRYLKLFENFNTDEIQSNVKDILLHIEDKGINTFVYTWVKSIKLTGEKVNMLSISIDTIDLGRSSTFTIDDDLFSTLEHLKSYLDTEDYILSSISLRANDGYLKSVPHFDCDDLDELKRLSYDSFQYLHINFSHKNDNKI